MYGVRKTTLKDHISGQADPGSHPGPEPCPHSLKESELASHLLSASSIGLGKTRYEVTRIAEGVAKSKGVLRGEQISHGWWQHFIARNLSLSWRSGDSIWIDAVNKENMREYFALLKEVDKLACVLLAFHMPPKNWSESYPQSGGTTVQFGCNVKLNHVHHPSRWCPTDVHLILATVNVNMVHYLKQK